MLNILICDDDKNIVQQVSNLLDEIKIKHNIDFKIDTNTDGEFSVDKNAERGSVYKIVFIFTSKRKFNGIMNAIV